MLTLDKFEEASEVVKKAELLKRRIDHTEIFKVPKRVIEEFVQEMERKQVGQ